MRGLLAVVGVLGGCVPEVVTYTTTVQHESAELRVDPAATTSDFARALHATLGRHAVGVDDCALFIHDWNPGAKDPVRITGLGIDLGASPVCGADAAAVLSAVERGGAIWFVPALHGSVTWSEQQMRDDDQLPLPIDRHTALERVGTLSATKQTVFVVAAPTASNAFEMLRIAQDVSRPGATVLFHPTRERRDARTSQ